ncbi:MAG: GntR family transcriptional regulator [Candidatus Pelethousia sp.]|nr:GntR family transcriptional regulator [Candidatus Pelethousia sp.]
MELGEHAQMQSVRMKLLEDMTEGAYRHSEKLPRENVLAARLNISRTQLRDSLAQLEREGFITRRHGVGTIINRHVLAIKVRMDMEIEFTDMIRQSGYAPRLLSVKYETIGAEEAIAERLGLPAEAAVLCVSRLVGASETPAIYCRDYIPLSLVKDASYSEADFREPIFSFLKRFCHVEPYMDITEICPACADAGLADVFGIPEGTPLLYMDELNYDIAGAPMLYSPQYYIGGVIKHTLMRKKF